jgi:hypothetical protein
MSTSSQAFYDLFYRKKFLTTIIARSPNEARAKALRQAYMLGQYREMAYAIQNADVVRHASARTQGLAGGQDRGRRSRLDARARSGLQRTVKPMDNHALTIAPYARVFDQRGFFSVHINEDGIRAFNRKAIGSNLRGLEGATFQFDKASGDLVDVILKNGDMEQWDGKYLKRLSDDARGVGVARLMLSLSTGRTTKKSARPCNCQKR